MSRTELMENIAIYEQESRRASSRRSRTLISYIVLYCLGDYLYYLHHEVGGFRLIAHFLFMLGITLYDIVASRADRRLMQRLGLACPHCGKRVAKRLPLPLKSWSCEQCQTPLPAEWQEEAT